MFRCHASEIGINFLLPILSKMAQLCSKFMKTYVMQETGLEIFSVGLNFLKLGF